MRQGDLANCDLCQFLFQSEELIPCNEEDGDKLYVCGKCLVDGTFVWYRRQKREDQLVSKKINLNGKLFCPGCSHYSYDLVKRRCTSNGFCTCTESSVKTSNRLRQLLELAEYVCPFCHHLHVDLNNKICLDCKGHLSKKSMAKAYKKSLRKGDSDSEHKATCTMCGGKAVWPEKGYCFTCKMLYAVKIDDFLGFIDGKDDKDRGVRTIKINDWHGKLSRFVCSFSIPLSRIAEVTGVKSIVDDQPKGGDKDVIKLDTEKFEDLDWKEAEVKVTGVAAIIKLRYLADSPETYVIEEYAIEEFENGVCSTIPEALKKVESKQDEG